MKLSKLKVDSDLFDNGKWVGREVFPHFEDLRLHVCAMESREARKVRNELLRALPREQRVNLPPDVEYKLDAQILARAVLKGWEGLEDENGPLIFTPEYAERVLADPDWRAFKDFVISAAIFVQAEASVDLETAAKN